MHRRSPVGREEEAEKGSPLPLAATGIALGLWVFAMLILAFIVVPLLFSTCQPSPAPA